MKTKLTTSTLLTIGILATGLFSPAQADVVVTQTTSWADGNVGSVPTTDSAVVPFEITNANSILIATVYIDNNPANFNVSNIRFGDGSGIGDGDMAPTVTFSHSRLLSYVFINPSRASGLSFRLDSATNSGIGVILYEVSGANMDLDSITTVTGVNSITTETPNELIVSFAGRNNATAPTVNSSSIFTARDEAQNQMRGGGSIASASAIAPEVGSNNITWNNSNDGRIAYAFKVNPDAPPTFPLAITKNPDTPGTFDFEWASQPGKIYDLLTNTDLATPIAEWPVYDDGETLYQAIPSAGEMTTLTAVPSTDPRRFFAIREDDAPPPPPLFFTDFEEDNGGFSVVTTGTGSFWEHGEPDAAVEGVLTLQSGNNESANACGVNLTGTYADNTVTSLRSPAIDLSGLPAESIAQLTFALAIDMEASASFIVRIIEENTDTVIGNDLLSINGATTQDWHSVGPLDMPEDAMGGVVRIEWLFNGPTASIGYLGSYIDDVLVTESTP